MPSYTIESASAKNRRHLFAPLGQTLRGRWTIAATAGLATSSALATLHANAPEIPGIHVTLDTDKRSARVWDPLKETADGRAIWARIEPVLQQNPTDLPQGKPWPETTRENLSVNDLKTWLFCMRSAVDAGHARMVGTPLPSLEEIRAMPGARDNKLGTHVQYQDKERYVDVVPENGAAKQVAPPNKGNH
jgi:hypothetical protein